VLQFITPSVAPPQARIDLAAIDAEMAEAQSQWDREQATKSPPPRRQQQTMQVIRPTFGRFKLVRVIRIKPAATVNRKPVVRRASRIPHARRHAAQKAGNDSSGDGDGEPPRKRKRKRCLSGSKKYFAIWRERLPAATDHQVHVIAHLFKPHNQWIVPSRFIPGERPSKKRLAMAWHAEVWILPALNHQLGHAGITSKFEYSCIEARCGWRRFAWRWAETAPSMAPAIKGLVRGRLTRVMQ